MTQPTFIATVNGDDVTWLCKQIRFIHAVTSMSRLELTVANPEHRNCGTGRTGDRIAIRFAKNGVYGEKAEFTMLQHGQSAGESDQPLIVLAGHDDRDLFAGGRCKGNFDEGMSPEEIAEAVAKGYKMRLQNSAGPGPRFEDVPVGVFNERPQELLWRMRKGLPPRKGGKKAPKSNLRSRGNKPQRFHGRWDAGDQSDATATQLIREELARQLEDNERQNDRNEAAGAQVTGSLRLRGYPSLRADKCILFTGIGTDFSGKYYVEEVDQSWSEGSAWATTLKLWRGGLGEGAAGGGGAVEWWCDPFRPGVLLIQQRDLDAEVQASFVYGAPESPVRRYDIRETVNRQRAGGEAGEGERAGLNLDNRGKTFKVSDDDIGDVGAPL